MVVLIVDREVLQRGCSQILRKGHAALERFHANCSVQGWLKMDENIACRFDSYRHNFPSDRGLYSLSTISRDRRKCGADAKKKPQRISEAFAGGEWLVVVLVGIRNAIHHSQHTIHCQGKGC